MGYGDITSANDLERGFAIVGMIIGATVFGYIIGNVAVIMENFNVVDAIENGKMNQIKDWLYDRKVSQIRRHKSSSGALKICPVSSINRNARSPNPSFPQACCFRPRRLVFFLYSPTCFVHQQKRPLTKPKFS